MQRGRVSGYHALAGQVDVGENILTRAQVDALKARAQDKVDEAKDHAIKAKRIADTAKDRLRAYFPLPFFWTRGFSFLLLLFLLLVNTGLVAVTYAKVRKGQPVAEGPRENADVVSEKPLG